MTARDIPAAEPIVRSTATVDVYRRATDSMRDTTKWIVTFIPGAAVVVTLTTVLPPLARVPQGDRGAAIAMLALAAVATLTALGMAARVLSTSETGWGSTIAAYNESTDQRPVGSAGRGLARELDAEQVLRLYGYTSAAEFFDDLVTSDSTLAPAAVAAGTAVMDFAAYRTVRTRFVQFLIGGTLAAATALTLLAGVQIEVAGHAPGGLATEDAPLAATLSPTTVGADRLAGTAGCDPMASSEGAAVQLLDGTLERAEVLVDDPRCVPVVLDWDVERDGLIIPDRQ